MSVILDNEISKLKKSILILCGMVEEAVVDAVDSVMSNDRKKAERVIENDIEIDHFELDVEEECLKILALHQPVAGDLRYVIACLKMNNDLERIGDLAVNIAKRALSYYSMSTEEIPVDLRPLTECTKNALSKSLEALIKLDADLASEGIAYDDVIDEMNRAFKEGNDKSYVQITDLGAAPAMATIDSIFAEKKQQAQEVAQQMEKAYENSTASFEYAEKTLIR